VIVADIQKTHEKTELDMGNRALPKAPVKELTPSEKTEQLNDVESLVLESSPDAIIEESIWKGTNARTLRSS